MKIKDFLILLIAVLMVVTSCKSKLENTEKATSDVVLPDLKLSLAQWSLHKELQAKKLDPLDFAQVAHELGFTGIEYVSTFYKDNVLNSLYLQEMNEKASKYKVIQLLIMVDGEGNLGDIDTIKRNVVVTNHHKWIDAAVRLGCHSIRVNAHGEGSAEQVSLAAIDGLTKLSLYAAPLGINVIVENHGGYSSDGKWLTNVIKAVNLPNCGTLPDFGNFCIETSKDANGKDECTKNYDRYDGVAEMMPFAKAVSAKSYDFGELGYEGSIDYNRMMRIVWDQGYTGFVGVEYEGERMPERQGITATKDLIIKCHAAYVAQK